MFEIKQNDNPTKKWKVVDVFSSGMARFNENYGRKPNRNKRILKQAKTSEVDTISAVEQSLEVSETTSMMNLDSSV